MCNITHYSYRDVIDVSKSITTDARSVCVWYDTVLCVTWVNILCDMAHNSIWVWHDSSFCVTWLIILCDMTHCYVCRSGQVIDSRRALWMCVWHDSLYCVIWLIILCDMTHCDACQIWASQQQQTRSGCGCAMTHPSVCVTWLIIICDMTHRSVWHDT